MWLLALVGAAVVVAAVLRPAWLSAALFAIAYGLDPQRPSHTYTMGGALLPLEARKLGMFGGFLIVVLGLIVSGRHRAAAFPPRRITALLVGFVGLMAADGANALFYDLTWPHLYTPDLRLRLASGLLTGLAMAALLVPAANGTLWRRIHLVPSLAGARDLLGALFVCGAFYLLVDARPALLYYPVAIIGIVGLLLEMFLINLILVLTISRRIGVADSWRDALAPATVAAVLIIAELAGMSLVRYLTLGDITSAM